MSLTFLPWARPSLTAAAAAPVAQGARPTLPLSLDVNGSAVFPAPLALELVGHGDVVGLEPGQVLRTDPPAGATTFEPTRFPAVEFDHPALPWLLATDAPSAGRLSPWLCLAVVEQQAGVELGPGPRAGSTLLRIGPPATPADELPDLTQAWAWAHVQIAGKLAGTLDAIEEGTPERTLSRLVCPRALAAHTPYLACVLPATEAGRLAGLGEDATQAAGAWSSAVEQLVLPVYHSWTFTTGDEGDFLRLAEQLTGRECPDLGRQTLEIADPALGSAATLEFGGALQSVHPTPGDPPGAELRAALADAIDRGADTLSSPLYGGVHAGATAVTADASGWLAELNLDPRWRVAAALGTAVIQAEQEDLVAAAWEQAGPVQHVNQRLDRGRLARAATGRLVDRHLGPLDPATLARVTAPAHARVMAGAGTVAAALVEGDEARPARLSPAYRRLSRARPGAGAPFATNAAIVDPSLDGAWRARLLAELDPAQVVPRRVRAGLQLPGGDRDRALRTVTAAADATDPGETTDPLGRVLVAPQFPTPMAGALARLAPEMLLPGAGTIPVDTVTVATTNPRFVAAFLVGLNAEMGRELAWRGFPVQRRATFFRSFWDYRGQGPADDDLAELGAVASEARLSALSARGEQLVLVVRGELLRRYPRTLAYAVPAAADGTGPILDVPATERLPLFTGLLDPDVRFFGFALTRREARGDDGGPGWFFVLQEQATEARFGPPPDGTPALGSTSAEVARDFLRPTARVAIACARLLPPEPA